MASVGSIRGDGDVEQAVAVEVVHDRAAGLIEAVEPRLMADVAELADVEFGVEEAVERDAETADQPSGVFTEGHVGHVEQPADPQVVGKLLEVLGEMLDRQPRTGRVGVHRGGGDRQDARALAPAHDAVLVLAAPQGRDSLNEDCRRQGLLRGPRIIFRANSRGRCFVSRLGLTIGKLECRPGQQELARDAGTIDRRRPVERRSWPRPAGRRHSTLGRSRRGRIAPPGLEHVVEGGVAADVQERRTGLQAAAWNRVLALACTRMPESNNHRCRHCSERKRQRPDGHRSSVILEQPGTNRDAHSEPPGLGVQFLDVDFPIQ